MTETDPKTEPAVGALWCHSSWKSLLFVGINTIVVALCVPIRSDLPSLPPLSFPPIPNNRMDVPEFRLATSFLLAVVTFEFHNDISLRFFVNFAQTTISK